jgi:hypothetical protein
MNIFGQQGVFGDRMGTPMVGRGGGGGGGGGGRGGGGGGRGPVGPMGPGTRRGWEPEGYEGVECGPGESGPWCVPPDEYEMEGRRQMGQNGDSFSSEGQMFGDFGGGFIAPQGAQAMVQPYGGAFGGFMMQQVPMAPQGAVAYYPAVRKDKKKRREETPFWPFQGPMRAFEGFAPYGYMGPLPYTHTPYGYMGPLPHGM